MLVPILDQLGGAAYRSALEDLKPFISRELSQTLIKAMEDLSIGNGSIFPLPQNASRSTPSSLPSQAPVAQHVPLQNTNRTRQAKRRISAVSTAEDPDPKRSNFNIPPTQPPSKGARQSSYANSETEDWEDEIQQFPDEDTHHQTPPPIDLVLEGLKKVQQDPNAKFKSSHQEELIRSVVSRGYTIGVLPTGGGKSAAYEIPPTFQGQATIAVLPFRVIKSQAEEKCRRAGLNIEVWTHQSSKVITETTARLILTDLETFVHPTTTK
jgi:hypothetical protein